MKIHKDHSPAAAGSHDPPVWDVRLYQSQKQSRRRDGHSLAHLVQAV